MSVRSVTTDAICDRNEPLIPADPVRGQRWAHRRRTLDALAWKYRTSPPWQNPPNETGLPNLTNDPSDGSSTALARHSSLPSWRQRTPTTTSTGRSRWTPRSPGPTSTLPEHSKRNLETSVCMGPSVRGAHGQGTLRSP
ncbi:hypothetical protein E6R62_29440 [Streptomyces sp. A1136]|nr:hypothetical protein E6R62_29440 [Streptomyces sp. A1136]